MGQIFKRKLYDRLLKWKRVQNGKTAILIEGARRVGKSTLVEQFAKNEYESYILIDFNEASEEVKSLFDNLMNNICKYALPGTRVYLSLEKERDKAVISFKNTSKDQLNISPDELLERFKRGDASRNSEGKGLGLSIAKSLTELQNGELDLSIDGDLFKASLRFPLL